MSLRFLHPHAERSLLPAPGLMVPHRRIGLAAEWNIYLRHRRGRATLIGLFVAAAWLLFWFLLLPALD